MSWRNKTSGRQAMPWRWDIRSDKVLQNSHSLHLSIHHIAYLYLTMYQIPISVVNPGCIRYIYCRYHSISIIIYCTHIYIYIYMHMIHTSLVQPLRPSTGRSHLGGLSRLIFAASPVGPQARPNLGGLPRDPAPRAERPSDTKALGGNQPVVRSAWD